ncbi:MAG: M61 family peptidase [Acidobacteria bacterium]|nr:MAG: M61 family peptidase [Acidobacteriota bacterium]
MGPKRCASLLSSLFLLAALPVVAAARAGEPISLTVDAREAPRELLHAREEIPVAPGLLRLFYPKWIPGEHAPSGPVTNLAGIVIEADGRRLEWRRDPHDPYTFEVTVPPGADRLEVSLDYLAVDGGQYSAGASTTPALAVISWNQVLVYPEGIAADDLVIEPGLIVPAGWKTASALRAVRRDGDRVEFEPVSLTTLIDSPVLAAKYLRSERLADDPVPYILNVAADDPAALRFPDDVVTKHARLVREALALFGAPHHRHYDFLVTLSDHVQSFGLEHHASSDDRLPERTWLEPDRLVRRAGLLPHELVHSWNGKYRRPAGMVVPDYQQPIDTGLLWVYEGLTSYLGAVLTARSGLRTPEQFREDLAATAARMAERPGRSWRPLADTARAAQTLYGSPAAWSSWRRSVDFYPEGVLLWLEVDALIREQSGGDRSLDDFCRAFFGPPAGPAEVRGYTFDDLVAALSQIQPYDWRTFFAERVERVREDPPLDGIERAGWRLVYNDEPNEFAEGRPRKKGERGVNLTSSLGLTVDADGAVQDVIAGSPADAAGLAPGMRVYAVAGRRYTRERLLDALKAAAKSSGDAAALEFVVEQEEFVRTIDVAVPHGPRYPHLERIEGREDLLSRIVEPRTSE